MKTRGIAIVPVLLLCGCASEPTPYQRAGARLGGGYSEKRVSEDTFYVTYTANSRTPGRVMYAYLCRRAAELTLRHGFRMEAVFSIADGRNSRPVRRRLKFTKTATPVFISWVTTLLRTRSFFPEPSAPECPWPTRISPRSI